MLKITKEQLDPKKGPKKIGKFGGQPVYEMFTKGGLAMVVTKNEAGQTKILGAAPHRAVSRKMAMDNYPDFVIEELSKSQDEDRFIIEASLKLIPYLQKLVDQLNSKIGE